MSVCARCKAVFLDRDGVICVERGYLHRPEDFAFVPGALEGLRLLAEQGYLLTVVTNQSGIGRGYFTQDDYARLTHHMVAELAQAGIRLAGIRHCPHLPDAKLVTYRLACQCRKPAPGMVQQLAQALDIDLAASVLVGDKATDIEAGRSAGVGRCMLVRTGHALGAADEVLADGVFDDLYACACAITATPAKPVQHPPKFLAHPERPCKF